MVDDLKETVFSKHIRTNACMNSQGLCHHAQDLYKLKLDKMPAWKRGAGHKQLLTIGTGRAEA